MPMPYWRALALNSRGRRPKFADRMNSFSYGRFIHADAHAVLARFCALNSQAAACEHASAHAVLARFCASNSLSRYSASLADFASSFAYGCFTNESVQAVLTRSALRTRTLLLRKSRRPCEQLLLRLVHHCGCPCRVGEVLCIELAQLLLR